jgi:hypothetical protein
MKTRLVDLCCLAWLLSAVVVLLVVGAVDHLAGLLRIGRSR